MPRYIMPGSHLPAFRALDSFTRGYIQAACWTECTPDNEELDGKGFDDLAPDALAAMVADCAKFQRDNANDLNFAFDGAPVDYDAEKAGMDFWLTRNGHGAGFWDRGLGIVGDRLSDASRPYGNSDLYLGDDGKVYLS